LHRLLPDIILDHNWHHATSNSVMNVVQIFKTLKSSNFKDFKNSISFNLVTRMCKHKNQHRLNIYIYIYIYTYFIYTTCEQNGFFFAIQKLWDIVTYQVILQR
jgi:hypothetical protein